jgi:hypothetical protein
MKKQPHYYRSQPPIIGSPRFFRLLFMIIKERFRH